MTRGRSSNADGQAASNAEDDPHRLNITIRGAAERQANDDPGDLDLNNRPVISIRGASNNEEPPVEGGRPVISIRGASNPQVSPQAPSARSTQVTMPSSPRVLPRKNAPRQEQNGAPGARLSNDYYTSSVDSHQQQESIDVDRTEQAQGGGRHYGQLKQPAQRVTPPGPTDPRHAHAHNQANDASQETDHDRSSLRSRLEPPRNRHDSTSTRKSSTTERQQPDAPRGPRSNQLHQPRQPADSANNILPGQAQSGRHDATHSNIEAGQPNWYNAPIPSTDPGPPPAPPDTLRAPNGTGWDAQDHSHRTLNGQISDANSAPTSSSRWPGSQAVESEAPPPPRQTSANYDGTGSNQSPLALARKWGHSDFPVPDTHPGSSDPSRHVPELAVHVETASAAKPQHADSVGTRQTSRVTGNPDVRGTTLDTTSNIVAEEAGSAATSGAPASAADSTATAPLALAAIAEKAPSAPPDASGPTASSASADAAPRQSLPRKKKKHADIWNPSHLFVPEDFEPLYSLVVLNQPIAAAHRHMFQKLWARGESPDAHPSFGRTSLDDLSCSLSPQRH